MSGESVNPPPETAFSLRPMIERRRGRPTKRVAAGLGDTILEIALRQFLDAGFSATSMDAVAAEAGVSKRTLYDRFPSKTLLFEAALHRQAALDQESLRQFEIGSEPFEARLREVAEWLAERLLGPRNIALYRLLAAEARHGSELSYFSEEEVMKPIIEALSSIFAQAVERGEVAALAPEFLANQFLQAICGQHIRKRLYGVSLVPDGPAMQAWIADAVCLFLNGARLRTGAGPVPANAAGGGSGAARPDW